MVFGQSFKLLALGLAVGLALAWWTGRMLEALLAGIKSSDPVTFLSAAALCILLTLVGSFLPAARAIRVDPIQAIRS